MPVEKIKYKLRENGKSYFFSHKEFLLVSKLVSESPNWVSFKELTKLTQASHDYMRKMVQQVRPIVDEENGVIQYTKKNGYRILSFGVFK